MNRRPGEPHLTKPYCGKWSSGAVYSTSSCYLWDSDEKKD
jgi:hypothetical protein